MLRFVAAAAFLTLALSVGAFVRAQEATPSPAAACATPIASPSPAINTTPSAMATPEAAAGCVAVTLREFTIDMPHTIKAGKVTFAVHNAGTILHGFEVEGQAIEEEIDGDVQPGQDGTLTLDLKPGTYEVYCPVDGHKAKGMTLDLMVIA